MKLKIIFSFWIFLILFIFVHSLNETPFFLNSNLKKNINILIPEGWCFFTKNPREPFIFILNMNNNELSKIAHFPNSSLSNFLGLSRKQKIYGLEYAMTIKNVPDSLWTQVNGDNILNVAQSDSVPTVSITNPNNFKNLCGYFLFAELEPVPYAWSNNRSQFEMPGRILKITVKCQ